MKRKRKAAEKDNIDDTTLVTLSSSPATSRKEGRKPHPAGQLGLKNGKGKGKQLEAGEKRQKKKRGRNAGLREGLVDQVVSMIKEDKVSLEKERISEGAQRMQPKAEAKRSKKTRKLNDESRHQSLEDGKHRNGAGGEHEGSEGRKRETHLKNAPQSVSQNGQENEVCETEGGIGGPRKKKRKKGRRLTTDIAAPAQRVKQGRDGPLLEVLHDNRKLETEGLEREPAEGTTEGALQRPASKQSPLLEKMRVRLQGGHFRMLNEQLYTTRGDDAFATFQQDPEQFRHYHRGYQEQMSHWPKLPVEVAGEWLRARDPSLVVADFGCGDARLAASVKNKVFSLDLVAARPGVIACNMAHTPLKSSSINVAVFCLSLMGTDYGSFLEEAHRVLVPGGWLLIAEVKSRFDPQNGGADPKAFVDALKILGFQLERLDESNKMFVWWEFRKRGGEKGQRVAWPKLKACIYKRR